MPRSSRSGGSRPAAKPASSTQSRGAHTMAAPPQSYSAPAAHPPAPAVAQSGGGGSMLGNMAATIGSVAAGSAIGHTVGAGLSGMLFGGGGGGGHVQQAEAQPVQQQQTMQQSGGAKCEVAAKDFSRCLEAADLQTCGWYLDQLKACQAAASQY